MQIEILFQFNGRPEPSAVTGVQGEVTDLILPAVGDLVEHTDPFGIPFRGRVTDRIFWYSLPNSELVLQGSIRVTLCMDRTTVQ